MEILSSIVWLIVTFKVHKIYHKKFNVTYFGFTALIKEWCYCGFIGLIISSFLFIPIYKMLGLV